MKANEIKFQLIAHRKTRAAAEEVRSKKLIEARDEFSRETQEGFNFERDTLKFLAPYIEEFLNGDVSCECQTRYSDSTDLTETGIHMFFDADHPNDRRYLDVTYEELLSLNHPTL